MSVAHALWTTGPGTVELREEFLPVLGTADVQVRAEFSAVSRGTESLVLAGGVPPSQHDVMRAPFQAGEFPYPVKYGYLSVGTVEQAGPRALDLVGRRVFCLHPHQDRYVVPAAAVLPVPAGVPAGRAVLAGMLETAVNGVWDAGVGIGDRVSVVGAGVLGLLVAALAARVPGTDVEAVDVRTDRAAAAERLGFALVAPDDARRGRDVVLHTSGTGAGLTTGLQLLGDEGLLAELSWYGDRSVQVGLGEGFHSRRLTIRASQVGKVPPARAPRWTTRRRLALALDLLADERFDALLDGVTPFATGAEVLPRVAAADGGALCHRFSY
ncbi:zinc-dependent alcohol dehydrogenase [Kineococcus aurantiacus]|uniref:2-desacetyl-2-hydroxyethyl bacteriochlorophyllide A dehydrogenase n=1 Tax=Kineococcus aurantiacus TaxID=37633 RepID=A0A7Y9J2S2_9ACTN|nr:zinc-binding alcohol dehydrogenase [Kineococcus aurantiacus]NYD24546.1 2-desacetyl-2-hydroxyethyl bacteriochlorophyllide A dehydrogenase [Kineococcus aurantiacus]